MFLSETVAQLQQNQAIIKEVTSYRDIYIQFIDGAINLSAPPQTFSVISIYKKRSGQGYYKLSQQKWSNDRLMLSL